ncbi:MAG: hypothetical protein A2V69_02375 [Candidatus Portnoybacteria bacterium RBG_13_40_8]|uniref:Radical SAM core domain-containing protein n=1 Tax=Candidatus Portnoybacteria bacterium RBG_13_40_8 TaxID=1801990 RepID=A0A1G2F4E9_9BACT|nr:MAG: hypothetical protein A2V69_02375 [Candidatus Portnoybacteria bacterium RBG_13_40_8]OGZ35804.1 MAG: hypothetical protein A2V60_02980 [Candidatus Portnoybacteria bacterium RIFCSPHIGHO2_01_FULL_39_19]
MKKHGTNQEPLPKLDFNVTNRCNFRCIHCCFRSGETLLDEFSIEKIKEVLRNFKELGGQRIDVTGGEPLMRKDIAEIIKIGKKIGLKIELVTNASLLTDRKLKLFKKLGLDAVAISLDGSSYKIYRKIRPVSRETYSKIVSNIKKCVKLGFYTKVNTVVFNSNLDDLVNINELCIKWEVNEHGFYYFTPVGRGTANLSEVVDPSKWLKIIRSDLYKRKDKIKLSIETPVLESNLTKNLNIFCYLKNPWHLQILPDGNVYPCAIMAFYNKPCGNLYSQTLKEIWYDKKLWDSTYYRKNILPLLKKFGSCVYFNKTFKQLIRNRKFKFICPMCKYKTEDLYEKTQ